MKLALNTLKLVVTAGASVLLDPAVARAATITYAYTGTVTTVQSPLGGTFAVGDTFSGTFVFDTEATGNSCGSACAVYLSPLQTYSATVGSYGFSGVGNEGIIDQGSAEDYWAFAAGFYATTVSGPAVNGLTLSRFSLQLSDPSGAALTGLSLVPPVLSDYSMAIFVLIFKDFATEYLVSGTIASLSAVEPTPPPPPAVPEPASLALLATGLAAVAASRTRRSK